MRLRPHHLIDIFKELGNGRKHNLLQPKPYGHSQHLIVKNILDNPDQKIELVCENDDICRNCCHLQEDNSCSDILQKLNPPLTKQRYNDDLDKKLFITLGIEPGYLTTAKKFLQLVRERKADIIPLATHPGTKEQFTRDGLMNASENLKES